jgi:hypothetical protein
MTTTLSQLTYEDAKGRKVQTAKGNDIITINCLTVFQDWRDEIMAIHGDSKITIQ